MSATYKVPDESIEIPPGLLKLALFPIPFRSPTIPDPANVLTAPEGEIFLITLFKVSATYRFPCLSLTIPRGLLNEAEFPVPSNNPGDDPAKVAVSGDEVLLLLFTR